VEHPLSLRIATSSTTKTPVRDAMGRCTFCGNLIEWRDTFEYTRIPLVPGEFPARRVPARYHWHVDAGIAYLGLHPGDHGFCRIKHSSICPALKRGDLEPAMADLRARLRRRMDEMIRRGDFIPAVVPPDDEGEVDEPDPKDADATIRHTLHYHGQLRICPGRIEDLRCVAATDAHGERCTENVLSLDDGEWTPVDIPHAPGRQGQMILNATGGVMWVWNLDGHVFDFKDAARILHQRCRHHAEAGPHPDAVGLELVTFRSLKHGDFILGQRPEDYPSNHPDPTPLFGQPTRQQCATPGCRNATVIPVGPDWICYECTKRARRRQAVHAKWQKNTTTDQHHTETS
jgi:hypothetical protein